MRRITLTLDDGSSRPIDINPAAISAITAEWRSGAANIGATVHIHGTCFSVTETRAEILALLAEPQPVAVTPEMVDAAWRAYVTDPTTDMRANMRAALEAALAVRAGA